MTIGVYAGANMRVRTAGPGDGPTVAAMAEQLAQSFPFVRASFDIAYAHALTNDDAQVLLAEDGAQVVGYLLGFRQLTFFAGAEALVEEIFVGPRWRGEGVGRGLMVAFERWATESDCALVSLATRRAAPFYRALGYEESAAYFRKVLRA